MNDEQTLMYAYVEYNPSWIYGGWHLYLAPIENGAPNRISVQHVWVNKYEVLLERVCTALGLARVQGTENKMYRFMQQFPNGALILSDRYHRNFAAVGESDEVKLWNCFRVVREDREKEWYADEQEKLKEAVATKEQA